MAPLNDLRRRRSMLVRLKWQYYTCLWKMDIHPSVQFSLRANLDRRLPSAHT